MTPVPPASLRHIGPATTEKDFLESGQKEVTRLVRRCGLAPGKKVLDVGCGNGRLAVALLDRFPNVGRYLGLDVQKAFIDWCTREISSRNHRFKFQRVAVRNGRYNPRDVPVGRDFRFQIKDGEFDVINAYSLFSHLTRSDALAYLRDLHRIMSSNAHIFLTAFIEEGVAPYTENPKHYKKDWKGPLHCVRYEKKCFSRMLDKAGLHIEYFDQGAEHNGQTGIYLTRRDIRSSTG